VAATPAAVLQKQQTALEQHKQQLVWAWAEQRLE
jgi:hypothetical protein